MDDNGVFDSIRLLRKRQIISRLRNDEAKVENDEEEIEEKWSTEQWIIYSIEVEKQKISREAKISCEESRIRTTKPFDPKNQKQEEKQN